MFKAGKRVSFTINIGTANITLTGVLVDKGTGKNWWVQVDDSRAGYYPSPLLRSEDDLKLLEK